MRGTCLQRANLLYLCGRPYLAVPSTGPSEQLIKRKFDSCHHNSVKLGFMFKIMPLNGIDFNMKSNFKKLEWHGSN